MINDRSLYARYNDAVSEFRSAQVHEVLSVCHTKTDMERFRGGSESETARETQCYVKGTNVLAKISFPPASRNVGTPMRSTERLMYMLLPSTGGLDDF